MSLDKIEARDAAGDLQALSVRLRGEIAPEAGTVEAFGGKTVLCITEDQLQAMVGRAWMMGATVAMNSTVGRHVCRICGCWELEACEDGCWWVEADLCSSCSEGSPDVA